MKDEESKEVKNLEDTLYYSMKYHLSKGISDIYTEKSRGCSTTAE